MATHAFPVVTLEATLQREGKAWYVEPEDGQNGYFMFAVVERDGVTLVAAGGAERELPTLASLLVASHEYVDWEIEVETARNLWALEIIQLPPEVQKILVQL